MLSKKVIIVVILGLIVVPLIYLLLRGKNPVVTNFEQCLNAQYEVLESYPRICRTPDGRNFVEFVEFPPAGNFETPVPSGQARCGIENCHGLDIKCGPSIPEACTFIYEMGDFCRQYARCEMIGGNCQLIEDPKFSQCEACVKRCIDQSKDAGVILSKCEEECRQNFE